MNTDHNARPGAGRADIIQFGDVISIDDSARLAELERKIERGLTTFVEVGQALIEIRDSKLYLIEHKTFSDYCKSKWKFSCRFAQMQMAGAKIAAGLSDANNCSPPRSESQLRPLLKVPPEQRVAVWVRANELSNGMQPTSRHVRYAVNETRHKLVEPYFVVNGVRMAELPAARLEDRRPPKMTEAERWEGLRESINSQFSEFYYEILSNGFSARDVLDEIEMWLREKKEECEAIMTPATNQSNC